MEKQKNNVVIEIELTPHQLAYSRFQKLTLRLWRIHGSGIFFPIEILLIQKTK
jgi:hypothetical protein